MYALNLGTRGVQEAARRPRVPQPPVGHRLSDRRRANGTPDPLRHHACSASATRWTAPGRPATRPLTSTAGWRQRRPARCDRPSPASSSSPAAAPAPRCRPSGPGSRTSSSWRTTQVDYISAHAYYEEVDGDLASFLASAVDMDHFIDSVVATADSVGARLKSNKRINISFDEWNVWYLSRHENAGPPDDLGRGAPGHRGPLQHRRRGGRRQPADLPAAPQRPGDRRLPGAAGQRHRADHDRTRWPGLAADHLPPVRDHLPDGQGDSPADRAELADPRDRNGTERCRWWTPWPPTTRPPAR